MSRFWLLPIFALLCQAQTTADNAMNPSDIANLPDPTQLGPPQGTESANASYNSVAALSSVSSIVSSVADAQASSSGSQIPIPTLTESLAYPAAFATNIAKRAAAAKKAAKRDLAYPIDTRNYNVPSGFTPAFASLNGSTQAKGYLTYKTLGTYDPALCAAACNKISACRFFNIYWEKDPDANGNPVDVIKCALYSLPQTKATATNVGQWRGSFRVIITGSNGYNKATIPIAPNGYTLQALGGAVDAPEKDKINQLTLLQSVFLDTYDPALCSAACDQVTAQNKASVTDCNYQTCTYANLYILSEDGVPKTTVCTLFTQNWDDRATKTSYDADNHHYTVSNSIGLTNIELSKTYPKTCTATDLCAGALGTCAVGTFQLDNWNGDGVNRYNGFYGNYTEGALLLGTRDAIDPQGQIVFRGSGVSEGGTEVGYVVHKTTGKCLTFKPIASGPQYPKFRDSNIILAACGTNPVPEDNQKFGILYYDSYRRFYCILGRSDTIYSQDDLYPAGGKAESLWGHFGGWCVHLTVPL